MGWPADQDIAAHWTRFVEAAGKKKRTPPGCVTYILTEKIFITLTNGIKNKIKDEGRMLN